ncbi:hypothetical protein ACIBG8_53995 [Nonomuraea sp. NPDC050556]|uniref:SCO4225 family membrane protein n=1 Tax=Nonomuraea sp. NPDC050556 TaxID=3364369 RepID=UPI0037BB7E23
MNRLKRLAKRIGALGAVCITYFVVVVLLALDALPHAGTGGGLEYLLIMFATAPTGFLFGSLLRTIPTPSFAQGHTWDYVYLGVLVLAGAVQAFGVWFAVDRLDRKRRQK